MKPTFRKQAATLLAAALASASIALSAPYENGQAVQPFTAADAHGQAFTFDPAATRFLLVSQDMETGKKANAALTALGKDYLPSKKAVFMASISGMPGIGRMFALPKMRKYNHRIILGDDAALLARFPAQAGKVTVIGLSGGKVRSVKYWTPGAEAIDAFLE